MAILTDPQRQAVWAEFMNVLNLEHELLPLNKSQLRVAVDATDNWIDLNAGSFNTALPPEAQAKLTSRQKARLLAWVLRKRFEVS